MEYPEQRRYILGRIEAEPDTEHGIELAANGNAVLQDLRRDASIRGDAPFEVSRLMETRSAAPSVG